MKESAVSEKKTASAQRKAGASAPTRDEQWAVDRPLMSIVQRSCSGCVPSVQSMAGGMMQTPAAQRQAAAMSLQRTQGNRFVQGMAVQAKKSEDEELIQGKFASGLTGTLQAKEEAPPNKTGMPDLLKSGIENISGMDLSGVRVHYNSAKPAQLNALAYTQGQDIEVGPGQEHHLLHEGWHVVQQMQGRVKPTMQAIGVSINDDADLEHEADVMSAKALQIASSDQVATSSMLLQRRKGVESLFAVPLVSKQVANTSEPFQHQDNLNEGRNSFSPSMIEGEPVLQRAVGFEFECNWQAKKVGLMGGLYEFPKKTPLHQGEGWVMETDGSEIEFVVDHFEEGAEGRAQLDDVMENLTEWADNMNAQRADHPIDNPDFITARWFYERTRVDTFNQEIMANPQATGGIRLERLETLYRSLSRPVLAGPIPEATNVLGGQASVFYAGRAQNSVNAITAVRALNVMPGQQASNRLAGLVGLICQYLEFGRGVLPLQTAKYMTWIMGRTDFGAMLSNTPEAEHLRLHPDDWENLVLNTAMTEITGAALPPGNAVIERPITDGGNLAGAQRIQIPITRHEWLRSMTQGIDLLTKHAQEIHWYSSQAHKNTYMDTRTELGHRLRGVGGLGGAFDTTAGGDPAAIVEFRSMMTHVPYIRWGELALRVFDFIVAVNAAANSNNTVNMAEN